MKSFLFAGVAAVTIFVALSFASIALAAPTFLLAFWLENYEPLLVELLVETSGELLLEDTKVSAFGGAKETILCSLVSDGFVGPESAGLITELLTLSGIAFSLTALSGSGLSCAGQENCGEAKVWAVHLPWTTELELWEESPESGFVILIKNTPGWYVTCTVLGINVTEEWTATEGAASAQNLGANEVQGAFSDAFTELMGLKLATCTGSGGAETGIVEGPGITKSDGNVSISSE